MMRRNPLNEMCNSRTSVNMTVTYAALANTDGTRIGGITPMQDNAEF